MDGREQTSNDTGDIAGTHYGRVTLEKIRPQHAAIFPRIRKADIDEAAKLSDIPYRDGLCFTIATARMGYAVMYDGVCEAVCGVGQNNDPWLAATDVLAKHPFPFFRVSKIIISAMQDRFDWLCNYVDDDNVLSVKWLKWAGFEIDEAEALGKGRFRRFHWKR